MPAHPRPRPAPGPGGSLKSSDMSLGDMSLGRSSGRVLAHARRPGEAAEAGVGYRLRDE